MSEEPHLPATRPDARDAQPAMEEDAGQARLDDEDRQEREEEGTFTTQNGLRSFIPLRTSRACDVTIPAGGGKSLLELI